MCEHFINVRMNVESSALCPLDAHASCEQQIRLPPRMHSNGGKAVRALQETVPSTVSRVSCNNATNERRICNRLIDR